MGGGGRHKLQRDRLGDCSEVFPHLVLPYLLLVCCCLRVEVNIEPLAVTVDTTSSSTKRYEVEVVLQEAHALTTDTKKNHI